VRLAAKHLVPVVALATGACFATRSDVQVLQNDLQVLQKEQIAARAAAESASLVAIRRDSVRGAQLDQMMRALGVVRDSLASATARVQRFQGDVREDLYNLGQQLIRIQTLMGQSDQQLRQFRLDMEARNREIQAQQAVDTGAVAASLSTPGPEQMYDLGLQQTRRGAWPTARTIFTDLLTKYPESAVAAGAQLQIAYAFEAEKNQAAADSIYTLVVTRYPRSMEAPTALYKHAQSLIAARKTAEARALIDRLKRDYPGSDAERLSAGLLPPPDPV
jgi:TolA-binding protein